MSMRLRPSTGNIKTLQRYTGILRIAKKARIAMQEGLIYHVAYNKPAAGAFISVNSEMNAGYRLLIAAYIIQI